MKRKTSALVLLLALAPTTTRPMDDTTKTILWVGGSAIVVALGMKTLWSWSSSPYLCAACDKPILEKEGQTFKARPCGHRYHTEHYNDDLSVICRGCEKERHSSVILAQTIDSLGDSLEKQRLQNEINRLQHEQEARTAKQQQEEYDHYYAQKKAEEENAHAQRQHEHEQARAAQQQELNRFNREKRLKDEQDARSRAEAQRLAKQEVRVQRSRDEQARQAREHTARVEQLRQEEQARKARETQQREFDRIEREQRTEQERIKASEFMMKECPICLAPLAQKGDRLIDLKKPANRYHVTALPCGHVYHTTCIKEAAKHDARCPECRTPFNAQEL